MASLVVEPRPCHLKNNVENKTDSKEGICRRGRLRFKYRTTRDTGKFCSQTIALHLGGNKKSSRNKRILYVVLFSKETESFYTRETFLLKKESCSFFPSKNFTSGWTNNLPCFHQSSTWFVKMRSLLRLYLAWKNEQANAAVAPAVEK